MKRIHINIMILVFVIGVFGLQYYLITSYINEVFRHSLIEVRNDAMKNELKSLKMYFIENFIFLFLQTIGMFLCLNIGFFIF